MSYFTEERITHHGIEMHVVSLLVKEKRCGFQFRVFDEVKPDPKTWRPRPNESGRFVVYYDMVVNDFLASWFDYGSSMISRICSWFPQHVFEQWDILIFYLCQTVLEKAQRLSSSDGVRYGIGFCIDFYCDRDVGLDAAAISVSVESIIGLQRFKYEHDDALHCGENKCATCFEKFEKGEELTRLPCLHIFHYWCLAKWFIRKRTCPLCRYEAK